MGTYTRLEQLFILAIQDILSHSEMNLADEDCGLILSTTKGNIDLLANHPDDLDIRVHLWEMGRRISEYFQAGNRVEVISNACISGVSALIVAANIEVSDMIPASCLVIPLLYSRIAFIFSRVFAPKELIRVSAVIYTVIECSISFSTPDKKPELLTPAPC